MVTVHNFRKWHGQTDTIESPPLKRTAEAIQLLGAEIIPGTAEEVDPSDLDDFGRYDPKVRAARKNKKQLRLLQKFSDLSGAGLDW
jgi:hypothetical protein